MSVLVYKCINFVVILLICSLTEVELLKKISKAPDPDILYLTPMIKDNKLKLAQDSAKVDPNLLLGQPSYTGFITVNDKFGSHLFFWYLPHEDVENRPWIVWLNGGPGVSSMIGLYDLIGPVKLENKTVVKREENWADDYSLLFIDNPVGAGFSFTEHENGYTTNEDMVSEQLYEFLQQFLKIFPQQRLAPLFLAGNSYAGKYIPAFGLQIHRYNQNQINSTRPITLKGLILGNAMIDPRNMMHYTDLIRELGFLEDRMLERLSSIESEMVRFIDEGRLVDASNKFNETIEFIKNKTSVSIYNYLGDPAVIQSSLEPYIKSPEVRQKIHVGKASFDLNNQVVYQHMLPDISNSSRPMLEELLNHYGVLCLSGQLDLIVPYAVNRHVYKLLNWNGRDEYQKAKRVRIYQRSGKAVAYKKSGGNFTEVLVRGCGHSTMLEKPKVVKFIVDQFINVYKNK